MTFGHSILTLNNGLGGMDHWVSMIMDFFLTLDTLECHLHGRLVLLGYLLLESYIYLVELKVIHSLFGIMLICMKGSPPIVVNDLWSFNISAKQWTLKGGTNTSSPGIYPDHVGIEGGWPAGRAGAVTWTSNDGLLFLFGGSAGNSFPLLCYFLSHFYI